MSRVSSGRRCTGSAVSGGPRRRSSVLPGLPEARRRRPQRLARAGRGGVTVRGCSSRAPSSSRREAGSSPRCRPRPGLARTRRAVMTSRSSAARPGISVQRAQSARARRSRRAVLRPRSRRPRACAVARARFMSPMNLDVEPRPVGARLGRGRQRGDEPAARRELEGAQLEQPLPLTLRGHAPGSPLGLVHVLRVAREDRPRRREAARIGDPVHRRPGDRDMHAARRQAGRLLERDARPADHRGGRRAELDRSAAGLAVGLRRGVVGPRARIGDPGPASPARGSRRPRPVAASPKAWRRCVAGDAPRVRRQIDERVDQRPAGALLREIADEAVRVDPVGGAEIDHAEHRLVREQPRAASAGGWVASNAARCESAYRA